MRNPPQIPIRVLIVEDQPQTREWLKALIGGSPGFVVTSAQAKASGALAALVMENPDVMLLDLELPDTPGQRCIPRFKELRPNLKVLILTIHDQAQWLFPALEAGADGYLHKSASAVELLDAIRLVHGGGSALSATIARRVLAAFRLPPAPKPEPAPEKLTPAEDNVLRLLASGRDNKEIASELNISPRTVESHAGAVMKKLHLHGRTKVALWYLHEQAALKDRRASS